MNTPSQPSESHSGEGIPTRDELSACLRQLEYLCQHPELCLTSQSLYAEIARKAGLLKKRLKEQHKKASRERDGELLERSLIREQRREKSVGKFLAIEDTLSSSPKFLSQQRTCYVCKSSYQVLHRFYDALCQKCGTLNYRKRSQVADLTDRIAVVTGGRLKIGYQVALRMLRCGARVIVTSRFPFDTVRRYANEDDYSEWCDRLEVRAADFRYLPMVDRLCDGIIADHKSINILINNATQTVRRPPEYYRHLLSAETTCKAKLSPNALHRVVDVADTEGQVVPHDQSLPMSQVHEAVPMTALMSQLPVLQDDGQYSEAEFPQGMIDVDGQQLDFRSRNSWVLELGEIEIQEVLEVHAVNAVAPFMLIQRLKPHLLKDTFSDRYIVNVSAVEGQFQSNSKTAFHPHTNMAKAGMNMLTRTSGARFGEQGIYMNSVDTGWITNEFPHPKTERMKAEGFEPPLDEIDGAARILDPVFMGINDQFFTTGKFYKDYLVAPW